LTGAPADTGLEESPVQRGRGLLDEKSEDGGGKGFDLAQDQWFFFFSLILLLGLEVLKEPGATYKFH
jgi:hypothetical protein